MTTIDLYTSHDFEALTDGSILEGTILDVYPETDTCKVDLEQVGEVDNVPIFYHCHGEAGVAGGAVAFSIGDYVYAINLSKSCTPNVSELKVVGFADGLKECCECPAVIPFELDEVKTGDVIGTALDIWLVEDSGCPPFEYSVEGTGYSWHSNGLQTLISNERVERIDRGGGD